MSVPKDEQGAITGLASIIYGEIASDLGPCHVDDFYDAFYNQLSGCGWQYTVWTGRRDEATERAVNRVRESDDDIERVVIDHMRLHYADRKGML